MRKPKIILVTGVSGTGKSTVLRELQRLGHAVVGVDEEPGLTAWMHKGTGEQALQGFESTKEFLATHEWICDIGRLKELLPQMNKPVFICGSADNVIDIIKLSDVCLLLVCPPETFTSRIDARTEHDYGKDEASRNALLGYYESYNQRCIDAGAIVVDSDRPVEAVVQEVLRYAK